MNTKNPKSGVLSDKEKFGGEAQEKLEHMGEKTRGAQGSEQEKQTERTGPDRK